jgi:hypothetical protein
MAAPVLLGLALDQIKPQGYADESEEIAYFISSVLLFDCWRW